MTYSLLGSYVVQSDLGDYDIDEHGHGTDYIRTIQFAPHQTEELLEKIAELHRTHRSCHDVQLIAINTDLCDDDDDDDDDDTDTHDTVLHSALCL